MLPRAAAHCMLLSNGETGAETHMADHGLGWGSVTQLCVALLKWVIFLMEKGERYSPIFVMNDKEATWPDTRWF